MTSIREKIAQTEIVLVEKGKFNKEPVGGLFIGAQIITEAEDNIKYVREEVSRYREAANIMPLVASDFENGCGSMINGLTPMPYLMGLGAANSEELAYSYGKATAVEGLSAGVNWSFSPVADLNINPRNPLVNVRSVSDNPDIAVPILKNIVKGMQDNGMAACAKHFPGDGVDWRDQHITTTCNSLDMDKWKQMSGHVFKELIDAGVYSVMAGHITLPAYQKSKFENGMNLPATLSYELVSNLLKEEMGFNGVVVSDALDMGGFLGWYSSKERSEIECFKAGCDMLLWPTQNYINNMIDAIENGYISMKRVDDAVNRIMNMKEKLGLLKSNYAFQDISHGDKLFVRETQIKVAEKSVTLVKDTHGLLPFKKDKKILLIPITHHTPAFDEARRLKSEFEKRGSTVLYYESGLPENELEKLVKEVDVVVYALFTRSFKPIGPIDFFAGEAVKVAYSLKSGVNKTVVISFGSPYFEGEYFERSSTYINAYSMLEPSVRACAKALYGEIPFTGFSPVNIY